MKKVEMVGQKFGRLIVLEEAGRYSNGDVLWECLCECGTKKIVSGGSLRNGATKSCGCFKAKRTKEVHTIHAMYKTATYRSWTHMIGRCNNPNNCSYSEYSGRGIKVCERWLKFESFLEDMGKRPEGMSIDRFPNNNGDYELGNCRWATSRQQILNQRMRKTNKTGVVGVHWDKQRQKHYAQITVDYKQLPLGRFNVLDDATNIRKQAEFQYRGTE